MIPRTYGSDDAKFLVVTKLSLVGRIAQLGVIGSRAKVELADTLGNGMEAGWCGSGSGSCGRASREDGDCNSPRNAACCGGDSHSPGDGRSLRTIGGGAGRTTSRLALRVIGVGSHASITRCTNL